MALIHYYRDKDTNETDMVVETDGQLHPLEIKKSTNPGTELVSAFKVLVVEDLPMMENGILSQTIG